jgi:hypothetical protein
VDNAIYVEGRRTEEPRSLEETYEAVRRRRGVAWIGLYKPTEEEFSSVAGEFGLHPLAVEDAIKAHQRPKLERYDRTLFLVLKAARYLDETETVDFGEIEVFVGEDFVVTVRHGEVAALGEVRRRLEGEPELLRRGSEAILYDEGLAAARPSSEVNPCQRRRYLSQRPPGLLVLHSLPTKRLPEPDPSQKMSGRLRRISLPTTELSVGAVPPNPRTKTTPPWKAVGPEGTLPKISLPCISTSLAPKRKMPTPERGGPSSPPGHERVLLRTSLPSTSKLPAGPGASARNSIPTQLLWTLLSLIEPPKASRMKMPKRLP